MPDLKRAADSVRPFIDSFLNFIQKKVRPTYTSPYDGTILKFHYRWTFYIFLAGFFSVWNKWYHNEVIACVSQYNADIEVRKEYINICLSYPYIEYSADYSSIQRTYLLYYRWIHWSFLIMAAVYYIPRKASKGMKNPVLADFLEQLVTKKENERTALAQDYFRMTTGTHNAIYFRYVFLNILVLTIDILVILFYNSVLHNRFLSFGVEAYPYDRDPKEFTDYMSVMFPPFVWCELSERNQMSSLRGEKFGCHLTFMELYEKIFLFLWYWLWTLVILTSLYIIYLLLMPFSWYQRMVLKISLKKYSGYKYVKVGDIFLLLRIKRYFTKKAYSELLKSMFDTNFALSKKEADINFANNDDYGLMSQC